MIKRWLVAVLVSVALGSCQSAATAAGNETEPKVVVCCDKPDVVPVIFGALSAEGSALVLDGKAVHGGCYFGHGAHRYCRHCKQEWVLPAPDPEAELIRRNAELQRLLAQKRDGR